MEEDPDALETEQAELKEEADVNVSPWSTRHGKLKMSPGKIQAGAIKKEKEHALAEKRREKRRREEAKAKAERLAKLEAEQAERRAARRARRPSRPRP